MAHAPLIALPLLIGPLERSAIHRSEMMPLLSPSCSPSACGAAAWNLAA